MATRSKIVALPGEPTFELLARDPDFARLVNLWADRRMRDIDCGERPESDGMRVIEARRIAASGAEWRRNNMASWRAKQESLDV